MYIDRGSDQMIANILVSGMVQGVGFRYATKQTADQLGLKGWVKNNPDGTVQTKVSGEDNKIQQFITAIRNNPTNFSRVDDIYVSEITTKEKYHDFTIE